MSFLKKIFGIGKKKEEEAEKLRIEEERLEAERREKEDRIAEEEAKAVAEKKAREEREAAELEEAKAEEAKVQEEIKAEEKKAAEAVEAAERERLEKEREAEAEKKLEEARTQAEERAKEEAAKAREAERERLAQEKREEEERKAIEEAERKTKEEKARDEERAKAQAALREAPKKKGIFASLKEKLVKSREGLFGKMKKFFAGRSVIDEDMYEELEEILIQSDIGMDMTLKIVDRLEKEVKARGIKDPSLVYDVLKDVMEGFLIEEDTELDIYNPGLNVLLVVGVNGVGKTTTIGKIASKLVKEGKNVVIGAGDTFRAAAIEQLEEWADRAGADIIKHSQGADPGAVVFDTLEAAKKRNADVAIIDTAGRLHNKNNLMKELEKINVIIGKQVGKDNYESILVIDGTTGQNGLNQAKVFNEVTNLTGFIVTKLDGTAKGGIVFSISEELKKPIKFIGVGEGIEDLRVFDSKEYIKAIFE